MIRRPPRSTPLYSSAASDVYKRQLFALCGALTLAEVAGVFPRTGGVYVFIRESWGRLPAFLFGWSELVIIRAAALGAISTTFSEYLLRVLGHDPRVEPY